MLISDSSSLENLFSPFETGFPSWDSYEPPFLFNIPTLQDHEPVIFNPNPSPEQFSSNSSSYISKPGSDEPDHKRFKTLTSSGSDETTPSCLNLIIDERKRRRKISNKESARRSRMRKQRHLESLNNQLNRLKIENRELMNRLHVTMDQDQTVRRENERLRYEAVMLRQRLWDLRQILIVRQLSTEFQHISAWPCNTFTSISHGEGQLPKPLAN